MSVVSILPPAVRTYVHDFVARARRLALLRGIGMALAIFAVWTLACCVIDRWAHFAPPVRLALLAAGLLAVVAVLWRPVRASLRRDLDWVDAADRIEQHSPQFAQRLATVTSRVLGPPEHRGSDDMLRELLRDVDRQAEREDPAALLPLRRIARPWGVFALAAMCLAGLWRVGDLEMPVLAARFFMPTADILPVTTTRLDVTPGSRDVAQSQPLRIEASVARLDASGLVSLMISEDDGGRWSRTTMDPAGPSRFAFTLASVDRDVRYYVTAGDATSRTYRVRVRRPPAVERFEVRYDYPAYTARSPQTVVNTDGLIEAPIGTRATLTVTATEPLDHALLTVLGEKVLMERVDDGRRKDSGAASRMRRASIVVERDGPYTLDLISDRQVPGVGPAGTTVVRAISDGKPLVQLPQAGQTLRLHPREILPLAFQALDDYGIANLNLSAQVNSATPVQLPIELQGDARRQERQYDLDLATMPLGIGDVVTLTLSASDRTGQSTASEPVQVLVSPRSVDLATYQRLGELGAAANSAVTLHDQLAQAAASLAEADREAAVRSLAYFAALNRANRQLTAASETATLLRQALFRAVVNTRSAPLATTLAGWIDAAQVQAWLAEDLFRRGGAPSGMGNEPRGLLTQSLETTRVLRDELNVVATGERAAAVLADRENLLASQAKASATTQPADVRQRLAQTLKRAAEDIAAGAKDVGLDPAAADLDAQLKARADAAATLLNTKKPGDFAAAATEWAQLLQRDRTQPVVLDERLSAAAKAEAVRFDGDLIRARDLQLAARAAARIEELAQSDPTGRTLSPAVFNEFAAAFAAVQKEHEQIARLAASTQPATRSTPEVDLVRKRASHGRAILQRWAGESVEVASARRTPGMRARSHAMEELALRAGAETAARNYADAAKLDAQLAAALASPDAAVAPATAPTTGVSSTTLPATTMPATTLPAEFVERRHEQIAAAVERAETIDNIGDDQQRLVEETASAQTQHAPALAGRQRDVAEAIGRADGDGASSEDLSAGDPNWRGRATAAVLAAQETLASMPQHLAAAQEAFVPWRDAVTRAEQTKKEAAAMPDATRQPAAVRASEQAGRDAEDAAKRFEERRRNVSPVAAHSLATSLDPYAPETSDVIDVIDHQLTPAFTRLEESAKAGAVEAFGRAADEARQAIDAAQRRLTVAQDALVARDPLIAAKWFARAAADSLSRTPPDLRAAQFRQRDTTAALARAWDQSIHEAAALRMASLPGMQSVYGPPVPATASAQQSPATRPAGKETSPALAAAAAAEAMLGRGFAAVREWGRLRPLDAGDADPTAPMGETEPAGYEEALRLYFDALGKGVTEPASPTTSPAPQ